MVPSAHLPIPSKTRDTQPKAKFHDFFSFALGHTHSSQNPCGAALHKRDKAKVIVCRKKTPQ
jgi:hypothetical protein